MSKLTLKTEGEARPGGKIRYEWANGKRGILHLTGEFLELEPYSRIVHVERMHMPDPTPDNHIETRFDADGTGTLMTMRMTLPDAQTRAAMLATGIQVGRRAIVCTALLFEVTGSSLGAQAARHPQLGDSIRVRFDSADAWHLGTLADAPGDTLILAGCSDCRTEYLTPRSVFQVEMKPRSGDTQLIDMHVSPASHIWKGVGIGAGIGLVVGAIYDSRCHVVDFDSSGNKSHCLPIASEVFPVIGAFFGLLGGVATRPVNEPPANDWIPVTFAPRITSPSSSETHTLNLNSNTSPSFTTYSFPSDLTAPFSRASFQPPSPINASNATVSALMNPRSKSV